MSTNIPTVDLSWFGTARHADLVRAFGAGLEEWGFVNVVGHGVDPGLVERCYSAAAQVFALPSRVKQGYATPGDGHQRGYTGFGVERAKDREVADIKEFWHVGREDGVGLPANQRPAEVPAFSEALGELFARYDACSLQLLQLVAEHLGWAPSAIADMARGGNSVLRVIHYPDVGAPQPGAVRAAEHEDINLITLLWAATKPGLEVMTRAGEWLAVAPPKDAIIVDTGDMMQLLTGGRLPAVTHRVVNPEGADGGRMSIPMFVHPRPEVVLVEHGPDGAPILAGDYLTERLVAIGVLHDGR